MTCAIDGSKQQVKGLAQSQCKVLLQDSLLFTECASLLNQGSFAQTIVNCVSILLATMLRPQFPG